jgi:hypothetical protein
MVSCALLLFVFCSLPSLHGLVVMFVLAEEYYLIPTDPAPLFISQAVGRQIVAGGTRLLRPRQTSVAGVKHSPASTYSPALSVAAGNEKAAVANLTFSRRTSARLSFHTLSGCERGHIRGRPAVLCRVCCRTD